MIPRKEAKRLLDEFLNRARTHVPATNEPDLVGGLNAVRDLILHESIDVLRGSENVEQKGRRYLTEGRLRVKRMTDTGLIVAECRGSAGELYALGYDPGKKRWGCTCIARGRCSHLAALQLVVTKPTTGGTA